MSTYASFEKHKQTAAEHESNVQARLEESSACLRHLLAKQNYASGGGTPSEAAKRSIRAAAVQQRLVVREYREAARLRPRDVETKERLRTACAVLRSLQASIDGPKPKPLRRFLAHYNLSIRYWDLGKAKQALAEAEKACQELKKHHLPLGCAEHNLILMAQVHTEFKSEHRRFQEAVDRSPEAVNPNYELGIHYFDKRMLLRAEAQLRHTRDRARAVTAFQLVEQDRLASQTFCDDDATWSYVDGKKARRMLQVLEDVEDDLDFIGGLRELWCVEEDAGKVEELQATGIRDGSRPHCLPCMHRRYSQDTASCDAWWNELCSSTDISLFAHAPKRPHCARPKSAPLGRSMR